MKPGVLEHLQAVTAALDLTGTPYRMIRPIGRGGMGAVYLIEDLRLHREVAIKVLDLADDESLAVRLEREAAIIAKLEHPGIVPVHDVGRLADGRVFYVMKRVRGQRLDAWLAQGQPLVTVLRVFQRVCEAVAFAHARGVVHRDLKPQNVMIGEYGEALVMDWGLARDTAATEPDGPPALPGSPHETLAGTVLGTPGFMAPEQARGQPGPVDARADVFALGATLYFLLTRRLPFEAPSVKEVLERTVNAAPLPVRSHVRTVAGALESVCHKALRKDPAERYPNAAALGADIGAWLDGLAVSAHREAPWERIARAYRKYQVLVGLVLAYLLVRTAVAWLAGR